MPANEVKLVNGTLCIYNLIDLLLQCDSAFLYTTQEVLVQFSIHLYSCHLGNIL